MEETSLFPKSLFSYEDGVQSQDMDFMDFKKEIKCEPTASSCENMATAAASTSTCITTSIKIKGQVPDENSSDDIASNSRVFEDKKLNTINQNSAHVPLLGPTSMEKNVLTQSEPCYYLNSVILQCPICDTSFRGGRTQLPSLLNHVALKHSKERSKLVRVIKDRYGVKDICDCFACRMKRGHYKKKETL